MVLDIGQKPGGGRLVGFCSCCTFPLPPVKENPMASYQDPNAAVDAPVKRQILMVLIGFAVATAIIAALLNMII